MNFRPLTIEQRRPAASESEESLPNLRFPRSGMSHASRPKGPVKQSFSEAKGRLMKSVKL